MSTAPTPARRLPFTGAAAGAADGRSPVVWISEPMHEIYRLAPGQTLRLPLLGGEVEVFVGGVWRDYARQFGAVVISRQDYQRLGGDFQATDLALWPLPGQEARPRLAGAVGREVRPGSRRQRRPFAA
jgi:putative ABC transport system permease protein